MVKNIKKSKATVTVPIQKIAESVKDLYNNTASNFKHLRIAALLKKARSKTEGHFIIN